MAVLPIGSLKKVSCLRSPSGIFTSCSCGTFPKRVAMMRRRCVGCQAQKTAYRDSAKRLMPAATEVGTAGMPSMIKLAPAVIVSCAAATWAMQKKSTNSFFMLNNWCGYVFQCIQSYCFRFGLEGDRQDATLHKWSMGFWKSWLNRDLGESEGLGLKRSRSFSTMRICKSPNPFPLINLNPGSNIKTSMHKACAPGNQHIL